MSKYFGTSQSGVVGAPQVLGGFLMGHRKSLISPVSASLVFSLQTVLQLYKYKMKITRWELYPSLPVLRCVGQRDDDVLVNEDEQGQEEAEAHGADHVHGRQPLKRSHVEDGPVVNFEDWNCSKRRRRNYNRRCKNPINKSKSLINKLPKMNLECWSDKTRTMTSLFSPCRKLQCCDNSN